MSFVDTSTDCIESTLVADRHVHMTRSQVLNVAGQRYELRIYVHINKL